MRTNRSIPDATVIPVLVYPDVRAAVAWLSDAFGFVERVRIGESHRSQMRVGEDGGVIVAEVHGEQQAPEPGVVSHLLKVRVPDVDAQLARARAHGAAGNRRRRHSPRPIRQRRPVGQRVVSATASS